MFLGKESPMQNISTIKFYTSRKNLEKGLILKS